MALLIIFGVFLIVANIYAAGFDAFCRWLIGLAINVFGEIGPLLAAFVLGMSAYLIRRMHFIRTIYAVIEIYFGVLGATIALSFLYRPNSPIFEYLKLAPDGTKYFIYIGLGSSIFVMVRGLDSWFKWLSEDISALRKFHSKARNYLRLD